MQQAVRGCIPLAGVRCAVVRARVRGVSATAAAVAAPQPGRRGAAHEVALEALGAGQAVRAAHRLGDLQARRHRFGPVLCRGGAAEHGEALEARHVLQVLVLPGLRGVEGLARVYCLEDLQVLLGEVLQLLRGKGLGLARECVGLLRTR